MRAVCGVPNVSRYLTSAFCRYYRPQRETAHMEREGGFKFPVLRRFSPEGQLAPVVSRQNEPRGNEGMRHLLRHFLS